MITLTVTKDGQMEANYTFQKERIVIGRQPECDVVIQDPRVSRKHAVIERKKGAYTIADVYSANGTVVNNKVISACPLETGAEILIAPFTIKVAIE